MIISKITQRKLKTILFYTFSWIVMSVLYGFLRTFPHYMPNFGHYNIWVESLFFGGTIGFLSGTFEAVLIRDNLRSHSTITTLFIRIISYTIILIISLLYTIGALYDYILFYLSFKNGLMQHEIIPLYLFVITGGVIMNILRSIDKKNGHRALLNAILGKFQTPKEKLLIFLFLDLRGATTLAEQLGPTKYSSFLREYFFMVSNVCEENKGKIYQFAGDGVFLTWELKDSSKVPACLNFFYDLKECFNAQNQKFLEHYGVIPEFKAAAHCGRVIKTEVGNYGSEIAFHGDTLNTTSRIQGMCNLLKKNFLISEDLIYKLDPKDEYKFINCGNFELKGKNKEIEIFAVNNIKRQNS